MQSHGLFTLLRNRISKQRSTNNRDPEFNAIKIDSYPYRAFCANPLEFGLRGWAGS